MRCCCWSHSAEVSVRRTSGILWVTDNANNGTLRAYNPTLIPSELWDSQQNAARDSLGAYVKFCAPTIAHQKPL